MSEDTEDKKMPEMVYKDRPYWQMQEHIGVLDKALRAIPYESSEETKIVRSYLIAQIEALKWASRLREV